MIKKKEWITIVVILLATWFIDRITKIFAMNIIGITFYGPIGFVLHHNHGAMLGLFSNLPSILRVVSLSTGGGFLIFTFCVIQYLLPIKSLALRYGISVLLGGILGNVTDRILWGYIIDFIIFGNINSTSPAFNMADAMQWVGYAMIIYALVKDGEILWPVQNLRHTIWVNPSFQLKYSFMFSSFGLALLLIAGTYSYTFFRVTIIELIGKNDQVLNRFLLPFTITFVVISFGFGLILFLVGRVLSHRTAGPLYAFEKCLNEALSGKIRKLSLRRSDEFKHLEDLANRINDTLEKFQKDQKSIAFLATQDITSNLQVSEDPLPLTPDKLWQQINNAS